MRRLALGMALIFLAACAPARDAALVAPCPPAALATCHASAADCGAAPFCYRTLGRVDCYLEPEPRRTVEEVVPAPAGCFLPLAPARLG